jgi:transposase-like protein
VPMTYTSDRIEIITSVQRRRRWTAAEKMRLVEQTFAPGMTVSLVARQNGIAPPTLHLAAARRPGCADRDRSEGRGCARLGLPRAPEPNP